MNAQHLWNSLFALSMINASACGTRTALDKPTSASSEPTVFNAHGDSGPGEPTRDASTRVGVSDSGSLDVDSAIPTSTWSLVPDLPAPDLCVELPLGAAPSHIEVAFIGRIVDADIHFLIDVTGSMGDEIRQIRDRLSESIIPSIANEIPDVRFSVAHFADYPITPFGSPGTRGTIRDELYRLLRASTADVDSIQTAMDAIRLQSGGDVPEAIVEALYITATGDVSDDLAPPRRCARSTVGYPCFSSSGSRVILLVTDAESHNGPGNSEPYGAEFVHPTHSYSNAIAELNAIGAKVLGLYSGSRSDIGWSQLRQISLDTGAVRADGTPIVFDIGVDGASLSTDIVEAIRTLVNDVPLDVDVAIEDDDRDEVDATRFVRAIHTLAADPTSGAIRHPDRFESVHPGTRVNFRIVLANSDTPSGEFPSRFRMTVILRGDGVTRLSETVVDVVIPSAAGVGCN